MVEFRCGGCGRRLRGPEDRVGELATCPICRAQTVVPVPKADGANGERAGQMPNAVAQGADDTAGSPTHAINPGELDTDDDGEDEDELDGLDLDDDDEEDDFDLNVPDLDDDDEENDGTITFSDGTYLEPPSLDHPEIRLRDENGNLLDVKDFGDEGYHEWAFMLSMISKRGEPLESGESAHDNIGVFREAVRRNPTDAASYLVLGKACLDAVTKILSSHEEDDIAAVARRYYQEACMAFSTATRLNPRSYTGFIGLATVHSHRGFYDAAVECCVQAERLNETPDAEFLIQLARLFREISYGYVAMNECKLASDMDQLARDLYERAVALDPFAAADFCVDKGLALNDGLEDIDWDDDADDDE